MFLRFHTRFEARDGNVINAIALSRNVLRYVPIKTLDEFIALCSSLLGKEKYKSFAWLFRYKSS